MEQKLDELLASVAGLKQTQETNKVEMGHRLNQPEKDVAVRQDKAAQHMVKKLKRDRWYEFKRKGNEKQFLFNDKLKDRIKAAALHIAKLTPTTKQETATL